MTSKTVVTVIKCRDGKKELAVKEKRKVCINHIHRLCSVSQKFVSGSEPERETVLRKRD